MWCCSGTENLWALLSAIIEFLCPSSAQYCTNQRVLRQYFASFSCKACSSIFFDEHRSAWLFQAVKQLIIFTFFQARVDLLLCCFANRVLWWKWHWNHRWTLDLAEARLCLASKAIAKWTSKSLLNFQHIIVECYKLRNLSFYSWKCQKTSKVTETRRQSRPFWRHVRTNQETSTIWTLRNSLSRTEIHLLIYVRRWLCNIC